MGNSFWFLGSCFSCVTGWRLTVYRGCFPPATRHPERQRRISVQDAGVSFGDKYRSAGRLSDVRWQTARGFRRLRRPGSRHRRGFAPGCLRFRPQSGLVQRGVLYAASGGSAAYGSENLHNRAGARWKCTPFGAAHHFPRRGKFTLRSTFTLISSSKYSVAKISPSGGDADAGGRRGCISTRHRRGCLVFHSAERL